MWDGVVQQLEKRAEEEAKAVLTALSGAGRYHFRSRLDPSVAFHGVRLCSEPPFKQSSGALLLLDKEILPKVKFEGTEATHHRKHNVMDICGIS